MTPKDLANVYETAAKILGKEAQSIDDVNLKKSLIILAIYNNVMVQALCMLDVKKALEKKDNVVPFKPV